LGVEISPHSVLELVALGRLRWYFLHLPCKMEVPGDPCIRVWCHSIHGHSHSLKLLLAGYWGWLWVSGLWPFGKLQLFFQGSQTFGAAILKALRQLFDSFPVDSDAKMKIEKYCLVSRPPSIH
jgi:hypothetical protein